MSTSVFCRLQDAAQEAIREETDEQREKQENRLPSGHPSDLPKIQVRKGFRYLSSALLNELSCQSVGFESGYHGKNSVKIQGKKRHLYN